MKIVILPGLDGTGILLGSFANALGNDRSLEIISYPVDLSSYKDLGDWLKERLPQDDHVIVAESFSGPLAIEVASQAPACLKAVILVASFARAPRKIPSPLTKLFRYLPYHPPLLARLSRPLVMGRKKTKGFDAKYRQALQNVSKSTLVARLREVLRTDVRATLPRLTVPLAYIRATGDLLVPKAISEDFRPFCTEFKTIEGPHFLLQAEPETSAQFVSDFLARNVVRVGTQED